MNSNLSNLNPKALWENFENICKIPHPSKKEEQIIQFVKKFGIDHGLETFVDEVGNVIIRKPATKGMENRKGIVLQGHLDMVPQKNSDTKHDFEKDPILPYIDGEWVKAKGTTLGADNGMGVAAALSVLQSEDLIHGQIEALFTIDEETGMTGAFGLKSGVLHGDILMNLDSEDEGELYVGCAGGTNANITFKYDEVAVPAGVEAFNLSVTGLKGGHSGVDISLERANSNKILFRILKYAACKFSLRIADVDGGSLRNAIPRESFATVTIPFAQITSFQSYLKEFEKIVVREFLNVETGIKIEAVKCATPAKLIDETTQCKLIRSVYGCPNGVMRMSQDMAGLVETSNNLAIVKSSAGIIEVMCLLRSSVDSAKENLENMIESIFKLAGAEVILNGQYPGWKPDMSSPILNTMGQIYKNKFGKVPEIKAIHAGLECGLLGGVYPNWDMISFGPTIRFPHSPDEKVNIESVEKFWDFLVETLKNAPLK